ncbi:MAG: GIY-YIG nuclease family protein [Solirubrobacteraceae bacterium]
MTSAERRRELRAQYDQRHPEAGVYALRNTVTGRVMVASATDLGAVRNKLEFARTTKTASVLDHRLTAEVRAFGIERFTLEILDVLEVGPEMTLDEVRADLAALEQLWREKLAARQ